MSHSVVSQTSFRVEYKRGSSAGGSMFSRGVRMQVSKEPKKFCSEIANSYLAFIPQVDIISSVQTESPTYVVQFTLIAGKCEAIDAIIWWRHKIYCPTAAINVGYLSRKFYQNPQTALEKSLIYVTTKQMHT